MEKYKRPSKAQITAIAFTMIAMSGGSYGLIDTVNADMPQIKDIPIEASNFIDKTRNTRRTYSYDKEFTGELATRALRDSFESII